MSATSRHRTAGRIYRGLLHLYPAAFRHEYANELSRDFERRFDGARGLVARASLWLDAVIDVISNASRMHVDWLRQDVRQTLRGWSHARGFAVTTILLSALGIGGTTAAFSVADHVLIRPLPFHDPERLVRLWQDQTFRGYPRMELSPLNFLDWQRMATSFDGMAAYTSRSVNLVGHGDPERIDDAMVSVEAFAVLGVQAALGRALVGADAHEASTRAVVLSDRFWRVRFGADPTVLGRAVILDEQPHVIVGVMPPTFEFPSRDIDTWTAFRFVPAALQDRTDTYLNAIARLKPEVSLEQARSEMELVTAQLAQRYPKENAGTGAAIVLLRDQVSLQARSMLVTLVAASLCMLLIVCLNLANLSVARALSRERELAVRAAVGAGRRRIVRQMLTESVSLAAVGGTLGILLAVAATPLLSRLVPTSMPIADVPGVDARMMTLAFVVTLVTGIGVGVLPAMRVGGSLDATALREGARVGTRRVTERLRSTLVVGEVVASVVLLVAAGLLIRALWRVQAIDPGFKAEGVLTLRTALPMPRYAVTATRQQFYDSVLGEIGALPGVHRAAYITFLPLVMGGGIWPTTVNWAGLSPEALRSWSPDPTETRTASLRFVTPGFFDAMSIPIVRGRDVASSDSFDALRVAVVSESFGRQYWPDRDPIGQRFFMAFEVRTIVGIARDIKVRGLERESEPQVYLPSAQVADDSLIFYGPKELVVRSSVSPATLLPAIRAIVARADPELPISDVRSLTEIVELQTASRRAQIRVLGGFAVIAFLLAGVGLHGVLAFIVSSQRREIGIRMALGARASEIVGMVLSRGLRMAVIGIVIGVAAAFGVGTYLQSLLAGVTAADPQAFGAAVALVFVVTLIGSLLPAIRAARIDPVTAIRNE